VESESTAFGASEIISNSAKPMQVLLVNNQLQYGGAETAVHQLRSRIPNTRLMVPEAPSLGVEVMYPRLLSRLNHSRLHNVMEKLFPTFEWTNRHFAKLQNDPADIVHIHNFHGDYASIEALAGLIGVKRVVWTFHGLWGVTGGCDHPRGCSGYLRECGHCPQLGLWPIGDVDRTNEDLYRKIAALAGLTLNVIAPSRYFYDTIRCSQVGKSWKVHHIPNGIDPQRFRSAQIKSHRLKILIVNRNFQDPHKGFDVVREALHLVKPAEVELTFVGSNSSWAIAQLKKGNRTRDLGYITDRKRIAGLYAESHIFLFASPAENFPCVILEAMASGCCVVATPSGGVVEQITDGENGFLAAEISGSALANALDRALRFRALIPMIGENARRTVIEKFSEDSMIEAHLRLYRSMIADLALFRKAHFS
jgi:glycosyltransferase involved in cell wall biosynthesis